MMPFLVFLTFPSTSLSSTVPSPEQTFPMGLCYMRLLFMLFFEMGGDAVRSTISASYFTGTAA
jgi:hypothetical protein